MSARGRYAPSPTGRLHAGNARTALLAWLAARVRVGTFVMRIEDLDAARIVPGAEKALLAELAWLGLDWDEGPGMTAASVGDVGIGAGAGPFAPYRQSERAARYDAAVETLLARGRAFPCACSRAEIARAASAPHAEDEEGPRYPGNCRGMPSAEVTARARALGRLPAIRFDGRAERLPFDDEVYGVVDPGGEAGVDDFVLRRADGVAAYQLAVVVDDAAMEIDEVVRGSDLLASTPRQIALYHALGLAPPRFAHVPLLLAAGGERMAKRTRPTAIEDLRVGGADPRRVVARLAATAGLCATDGACTPAELLHCLPRAGTLKSFWDRVDKRPAIWTLDGGLL